MAHLVEGGRHLRRCIMEDKLTLAFAQRVWTKLEDEDFRTDLERSLARLCTIRGLERGQFHDFNYTLYVYCAQWAGEFDQFRASLKTWMIMQARALIINIVRDRGWACRTFGWEEVTESDMYRRQSRGDSDGEPGIEMTMDRLLFTTETPEDILIRRENAIARKVIAKQVMIYAEFLDEKEKCCLDLL